MFPVSVFQTYKGTFGPNFWMIASLLMSILFSGCAPSSPTAAPTFVPPPPTVTTEISPTIVPILTPTLIPTSAATLTPTLIPTPIPSLMPELSLKPGENYFSLGSRAPEFIFSRNITAYYENDYTKDYEDMLGWMASGGSSLVRLQLNVQATSS